MSHQIETEPVAMLNRYANGYRATEGRINRNSAIALALISISSGPIYLFHQEPSLTAITVIGASSLVGLLRWRYLRATGEDLSRFMRLTVLALIHDIREKNDDSGSPAHPLPPPPTPPTLPGSLSPSPVPAAPPPGSLEAGAEAQVAVRV